MVPTQSYVASYTPVGYPPLVPFLPQSSAFVKTVGGVAICAAFRHSKPVLFNPRKLLLKIAGFLLALLLIQEIRLENRLITDLSPVTGGKLFNNLTHFLNESSSSSMSISSFPTQPTPLIQCFHGFGASSLSFLNVVDHFRARGCPIIAADLTGFGFSIRQNFQRFSSYLLFSPAWNALRSNDIAANIEENFSSSSSYSSSSSSRRRVIIGHSMGCLPALFSAVLLSNAGKAVTLVLESPAFLVSPFLTPASMPLDSSSAKSILLQIEKECLQVDEKVSKSYHSAPRWRAFFRMLSLPFTLPFRIFIRRLVYWETFWKLGFRLANSDISKSIRPGIAGYTLPRNVRGFDSHITSYFFAQFLRPGTSYARGRLSKRPLVGIVRTLEALLADGGRDIKVVIVHGVQDKLVPVFNSRRLKYLLPALELREIDNCGHVPHEELPEVFNKIVEEVM